MEKKFVSENNQVFRAGIIPYTINPINGEIRYMFMKPSDPKFGGPDWQMAKGRVEGDDDNMDTAIREGAEELGLKESNIISVNELGSYLGRTTVFICEVKNESDFNPFHYETGDIIWMNVEEFSKKGRDLHIQIVYDAEKFIRSTDENS